MTKNNKNYPANVLIFIDDYTKCSFFRKFEIIFKKNSIHYSYFTDKYSLSKVYKDIEFIMHDAPQIKFLKKINFHKIINESIEYQSKQFSYEKCKIYCYYCSRFLLQSSMNYDQLFLFNGSRLIHKLLFQVFTESKKNVLFFENSNIEGKIICDRLGVNLHSTIKYKTNLYNYNEPKKIDLNSFLRKYKLKKLKTHFVKQSIYTNKLNFYYYYDFFKKLQGYPLLISLNIPLKFINSILLFVSKFLIKILSRNKNFKHHVFYPFQVSDDSQLIIHSSLTNIDALNKIRKFKKNIVVKFHPAERNGFYILKTIFFCVFRNLNISNANTWALIDKCSLVATINSTVGLEALMCKKSILCLENPIYKSYDSDDLKRYIFSYLIDVDMFSDEPINHNQFDIIMNRNYFNNPHSALTFDSKFK